MCPDPFLPYISGLFDGEGSIGIYRNGSQRQGRTLRAQLTQTVTPASTQFLRQCRDRWFGSLSEYNKADRRTAWNWQVSARSAIVFLSEIRPWLLLKADQADVALIWWAGRPTVLRDHQGRILPFPAEAHVAAEEAERELKRLKQI